MNRRRRELVARGRFPMLLATIAGLGFLLTACASRDDRVWGEHATLMPGAKRLRIAFVDAARRPGVWLPLAGAALLQVNGWDRKVSNWARRETPVYGSQLRAAQWSDSLRSASTYSYVASALLAPGPDQTTQWLLDKGKGLGLGLAAVTATDAVTAGLKQATRRVRPDGSDDQSFPSGHTSHAAITASLARENLQYIGMDDGTRRVLDLGLDTLVAGEAWARVEAGEHFPSDTLFSIGLANYLGSAMNDAFMGEGDAPRVSWRLLPSRHGAKLQWILRR